MALFIFNIPLLGYNATVLAYGQTGSGKTYSMGTQAKDREINDSEVLLDSNDGMIPRAVDLIFQRIRNMGKDYEFKVPCLSIHTSAQAYKSTSL